MACSIKIYRLTNLKERPLALERLEDRCLLSYSITDLGTLGGNTSYPFGINNADPVQVVGESNTGSFGSPIHAFVWDSSQGMQDLGTLGGSTSAAFGINDAGQVVGWAATPTSFAESAFIWDSTNGMQSLGGLSGSKASRAFAINNAGQVVGWSGNTYFLDGQAVLWDNGTVTALGTVGNRQSAAHGINAGGQVVGSAGSIGDSHALLWADGSIQDLGALSTWGSTAAAINSRSHVTGITYVEPQTGAFLSNPYVYTPERGLTDLGTLDCPPGYYGFGGGEALNDLNQVTGFLGCVTFQGTIQSYSFAAVWNPGQGWQDLNSLIPPDSGWTLAEATAVNERGQIAGYGFIQGQTHAYLLTPSSAPDVVGRSGALFEAPPAALAMVASLGLHPPTNAEALPVASVRPANLTALPSSPEEPQGVQPAQTAARGAPLLTPRAQPAFGLMFPDSADDGI